MMRSFNHHVPAIAQSGRKRERGVIIPVAALSMVTILIVIALVVDGSQAYTQRRDMQNAADAAALAGARALDRVKFDGEDWTAVNAVVQSVADDNGADEAQCDVITNVAESLGSCTEASAVNDTRAAGVHVWATDVRAASLPAVTNTDEVEAKAYAAATIQTFVGGTGSPFIVCGNPLNGDGWPILRADGTIDPVSATNIGMIDLQAAQLRRCGAGDAFKGKLGEGEIITGLPADVRGETGNGFNDSIYVEVLGANPCTEEDLEALNSNEPVDCDMILPIADNGWANGQDVTLHIVAWAIFHVEGDGKGNPKYGGTFVGSNAFVSGGQTSTQVPTDPSTLRAIRLIM